DPRRVDPVLDPQGRAGGDGSLQLLAELGLGDDLLDPTAEDLPLLLNWKELGHPANLPSTRFDSTGPRVIPAIGRRKSPGGLVVAILGDSTAPGKPTRARRASRWSGARDGDWS